MPDPPPSLIDHLPMFVLDVMRYADSYDSILETINEDRRLGWAGYWGRAFSPVEIDRALNTLRERDLIEENREIPDYYSITIAGWRALKEWVPPGKAGERVIISRALREWDPIGVIEDDPALPQDEYESYRPTIAEALTRGAGIAGLTDLLSTLRTRQIGLSPDAEEDARIAKKLHAALSAHWERETGGSAGP
jgi:DNA-binding PadR family transcriptional regulator